MLRKINAEGIKDYAMDCAPKEIKELVERFAGNIEDYKRQGYNEAGVRKEFIDPFFEALGWDIANKGGIAEAYKDVIHEDAIKIGGTTKAPDYCFRIGTTKKFFVEAKKPSVDISSDISPAYQLRRYAWSAKLPLSILTDFEEFAVYDCQIRPNPEDKPSTGRIMLFTYKDYADKWEQIAKIFSKEAVYKGLFDKYASEKTTKRGTTTVDKEFLAEIEEWRNELAKNIAIRNGKLSVYDLNFAVQKTIDRILFLRICEDRGIERSEQLLGLINGSRIYPRLFELFERADEKYNSGIFHFRREKDRPEGPDELSANLKIDDDILTRILKDLYYPRSPYEFSVMPAEILGQVYEQFLGKVIRLTASHQAKVEEKPEVKKAGGVYYTPSYIVDYIVKNTVGKLCENKTPKQIEKLKILDPACGSGSFLIGAYQYLLDFHRDWYVANGKEIASSSAKGRTPRNDTSSFRRRLNKQIYQGKGKQWFLTIDEKKRILLNNIYGVDIDSQAAEVTKLSLLLKVLENETQESLRLFHERALPDLGNNIKCGNSLIGTDFYQKQQLTLFGDEQQRKINAFDWQKEFAPIFKQGGFDAVIGNPPYVRSINLKETNETAWNFYRTHYHVASSREWDIYLIFVEQCLRFLKTTGKLGFILPNKFLNSQVGENLRSLLSKGKHLEKIVHFGAFQIFRGVTTYTCLLFLSRRQKEQIEVARYTGPVNRIEDLCPLPHQDPRFWSSSTVSADSLQSTPWNFAVDGAGLMEKIRRWPGLGNIAEVFQGAGTRADKVYLVEDRGNKAGLVRVFSPEKESEYLLEPMFLKPALRGRSIRRYEIETGLLLIVPYEAIGDKMVLVPQNKLAQMAPRILAYLCDCKSRLNEREDGRFKGEGWYCYGRPQNMNRFEVGEKIVLPDVCKRGTCSFDRDGQWLLDTCYGIARKPETKIDLQYILAILNSPLLTYFLKETGTPLRGGYFRMKTAYLNPFPIRTIDFDKSPDKSKHDKIVSLVEQMLELHKKLVGIKNPDEKTRIQRQIDSTDEQIDKLVYDLYDLTEEEIKIVEGSNQ